MTSDDGAEGVPTGIDLGSGTTVAAVSDGETTRVLGDDGTVGTPSRLAITDDGVAVGAAAAAADAPPVRLLPHERSAAANESAAGADGDSLPLREFLAREFAGTSAPGESGRPVEESDSEALPADDGDASAAARTVLIVPGAYTYADAALVERAARAAGLDEPTVVRSPLGVAASELLADPPEAPRCVAVADVGVEWCDLALVRGGPEGSIDVLARESLADHGRRTFDAALARWVLEEVAADLGAKIEVTPDGMAPLTEAAHEALAAVDVDEQATVAAELSEGVDVVEGGWLGTETLPVDVDVDLYACYDALEGPLTELQDRLAALLDGAGIVVEDVDGVVVAGDGVAPTPVVHGFEDFFDQAATLPSGADRYTASAVGAALLAASLARGESPVGTETFAGTVEVRVLGPNGPEFREVASPGTRADVRPSVRVQKTAADRGEGYFEVWFHDDLRGEREEVASVVVSGLPRRESAEVAVDVTFEFDTHWLSPDRPPSVTVSLADGSDPEDWTPAVAVSTGGSGSAPWFAGADHDPEAIDGSRSEAENATSVTVWDPERAALAEVSDENVAEVAHRIRNKLWERGVKNEDGFESEELGILVREFDSKLAGMGIESIEPSVGGMVDPTRHEIARTCEAPEKEGTILELETPGMAVGEHVVRPARVVVAG